MKNRSMQALLGVGLVTLAWVANAQTASSTQDDSSGTGRLRRAPVTARSGPLPQPQQDIPGEPSFDAGAWKEALSASDLDHRQASYEELVDVARRDRAARTQLEEWASGQDELAWTSRLALRELERTPLAGRGLRPGDPLGGDGLDSLFEMPFDTGGFDQRQLFGDLEMRLNELFGRMSGGNASVVLPAPGTSSRSESFQLETTPDGVKVRVQQDKDGQTETREYEAKDMEELLELYPELREHIQTDPFAAAPDLRAELDGIRERLRTLRQPRPDGGVPVTPREVPTDVLGVYVSAPAAAGSGLLVERIEPGTIAQAIGIQRGEVLIEINGIALGSAADVSRALAERKPEQELAVELRDRRGEERTLTWKPPASGSR